jgi:hypothetical protein
MSTDQALALFPQIIQFIKVYQKIPDKNSIDPHEKQLAQASKIIKSFLTSI